MITKSIRDDTGVPLVIVDLLKDCAQNRDLDRGRELHADVARRGLLDNNEFVGNAVINVYAKCGTLVIAHEVFNHLPKRDVVSWNILIAGYAEHGHGQEAFNCFKRMKLEGFNPNTITFLSVLKAVVSTQAAGQGEEVYAQIESNVFLKTDIIIGNAVIDMYGKCGMLSKAQGVFDELLVRNVVSWNVLIAGYAHDGNGEAVLDCFEHMQLEGVPPDAVTFLCSLKACGLLGALDIGQWIHTEISRKGLSHSDVEVYNALVDMYAKCSALSLAQEVFDSLHVQNIVSWNSLIGGFAQQGYGEEALRLFEVMLLKGLTPNSITFVCILKVCISLGTVWYGQRIHAYAVKVGLVDRDSVFGTALVDMYAKCVGVQAAKGMFDKLVLRTRASWNVLIAGYLQAEQSGMALTCFEVMCREGHSPDAVTFLSILKACGNLGAASKGEQIHAEIDKVGFLEEDFVMVANALVDMYAKCGLLAKAQEVFNTIPVQSVVSWNVLIAGFADHGHCQEALNCFEQMQLKGICPDDVTFVYVLKAYGGLGVLEKGQELHDWIVRENLLENDAVLGTALVNMYVDCGMLLEAQVVSDTSAHDEVSWNALISGFTVHLHGDGALQCYEQMQQEGFSLNNVTFVSVLRACASIGATFEGQKIHARIAGVGSLEKDMLIGTALLSMYVSFGMLSKAQDIFDSLPIQDGVLHAALITGYAQLGDDKSVSNLCQHMVIDGEEPDPVNVMVVLNACSHTGRIGEGIMYFQTMSMVLGIIPTVEHHTCIVDLFGRAGALDKAIAVIQNMPFPINLTVWHNMLGACQKHGNVELGRVAFKHAIQLNEKDVLACVSMRNIYAAAGMQNEANEIESLTLFL
ncbi:hypothetical protein GOP47_0025992 [Adiantum capillus-veneris]|uniref:Pentatricopeptide repeat-containing protein n=1 Tax=Adiantum capillus-veneris TaxID=13818 RepID=A0A9D4U280_ADICA|nr:hypothetical protein GOP47_0025992 [Adiantum capillus-veneris]